MAVLHKLAEHKRGIFLGILAILAISLGLYFILKSEEAEKRDYRASKVEVEEVRIGSMTRTITAVGTLRAQQTVILRPEINGVIAKIHIDGGEYVNEGDPLFTLEDRLFRAEVKEAEAKLALARVQNKRATKLEAQKFGSAVNRDKALADLNVAEALLESAKSKLDRTIIKAPFDGIVGLHSLSLGAPVDQNKELITLVDINPMKVDFKVPAKFLRYISTGQRVKVAVDGFREKKFPGLIEGIDATVDTTAHSIEARALIPNKNRILKPGLFARVDVVVGTKSKALIVPAVAVDKLGDQEFVYKVVEGRAFQTPVITGIQEGENIEILRGVNAGDHIVTVGQLKLQDGSPVRYELDGKTYAHNQEVENKKIAEIKARKEAEKKVQEEKNMTQKNDVKKDDTTKSRSSEKKTPEKTEVSDEEKSVTPEKETVKDNSTKKEISKEQETKKS
tara:strand:- start:1144 stop:2490 length:1347 start_codon:yes stop_codon:yes gene_type:complete